MKSPDDAPDQQMDDLDFEILDGIRALFERVDPMPADLPERVRFALAMRGLESEVARLVTEEDPRLVGARGTEQSRTVTFDSASLSIVIRIEENKNGSVRIDGWLAPPSPARSRCRPRPRRSASPATSRDALPSPRCRREPPGSSSWGPPPVIRVTGDRRW